MKRKPPVIAWRAVTIFSVILIVVVTILDQVNRALRFSYWGLQVGLISLGVLALVIIGWRFPDLSAQRWVLLAFGIGALTIIPAVLMSLNPPGDFWSQYFTIGLSMAAGSFLSFLFINLISRLPKE